MPAKLFISFQIAARHRHYQILPLLSGVGFSAVLEMMLFLWITV
jgi:hypothetical protein